MPSPPPGREFPALLTAETLSVVGDQLSRVALALLVFERTRSAGLSGLTYALTYLPTVAGALTLSQLADRRPRRQVSVAIDTVRALIMMTMALPGLSLPVLCGCVGLSAFLSGPYAATRLALLRDVLPQDQFGAGMAVRQSLSQGGQLIGYCAGGVLATTVGPSRCLLIDALTFAAAALIVQVWVRPRPAALTGTTGGSTRTTFALIWRSPSLRAIFLSTGLGLFLTAPKALATPLAFDLHLDTAWVGIFMASEGLFSVVTLAVFARYVDASRYRRLFPAACLVPGLPLLVTGVLHQPLLVVITFGISGATWSVLTVLAASSFADLLPNDQRGRGMGIAASMNATAQGAGAFLAGVVADQVGAGTAIGVLALAGGLFALLPSLASIRLAQEPLLTRP
ncbi:MFS transporter [Kineosporia sp. NBRC 101731]|uniref:MFS transporter n=1 Tax=Kineosporia sp. NBRC 101731 TaxID=3032199 RepID=UPI0024A54946|nr:MFS transporter [Kineosporia sp. NBRC 101731]GLY28871.1 MFS transporter [Kineosporia sp. NBRC 101731]